MTVVLDWYPKQFVGDWYHSVTYVCAIQLEAKFILRTRGFPLDMDGGRTQSYPEVVDSIHSAFVRLGCAFVRVIADALNDACGFSL
jgi:hypothetical protein